MAATSGYTSVLLRQHASLVEPLHRQHANPDDTNSAVEIYLQVGRDVRPRSMLLELAAQVIKDPNPNPNPNPSPNPSPNPNPHPNPNPNPHPNPNPKPNPNPNPSPSPNPNPNPKPSQVINKPCYHQLRTTEQLGYIVFSGLRCELGVVGLRVLVQSSEVDAATPQA
jgi:outer membrane biosynthesis protein TonB